MPTFTMRWYGVVQLLRLTNWTVRSPSCLAKPCSTTAEEEAVEEEAIEEEAIEEEARETAAPAPMEREHSGRRSLGGVRMGSSLTMDDAFIRFDLEPAGKGGVDRSGVEFARADAKPPIRMPMFRHPSTTRPSWCLHVSCGERARV